MKDSERRNGKFISEASSLEDGFTESSREISLEDIVNSLTVESYKYDRGGKNGKNGTGFKEFSETEGR